MKKTLAAVLAAAMALSTATVVFAEDFQPGLITDGGVASDDTSSGKGSVSELRKMDKDMVVNLGVDISGLELTNITQLRTGELSDLVKAGLLKANVSVASGRDKLSGTPSVSRSDGKLQLKVKFKHTYGTDTVDSDVRVRLTATKDIYFVSADGDGYASFSSDSTEGVEKILSKGDTLTLPVINFKTGYDEVTAYGEDMTVTRAEVGDQYVIAKGSSLYDAADSSGNVDIWFEDYAVYKVKNVSPTQKDVNLSYSTAEISTITDEYPEIDFEFIEFKGKPRFTNSGTMTFAATYGEDTQVYTWDGEVLDPLVGDYDKTYKTIEVKGIKQLGTYVIASQIIEPEEEPEEPAEPVDSTPVAEPDDEGQNPNTGAC